MSVETPKSAESPRMDRSSSLHPSPRMGRGRVSTPSHLNRNRINLVDELEEDSDYGVIIIEDTGMKEPVTESEKQIEKSPARDKKLVCIPSQSNTQSNKKTADVSSTSVITGDNLGDESIKLVSPSPRSIFKKFEETLKSEVKRINFEKKRGDIKGDKSKGKKMSLFSSKETDSEFKETRSEFKETRSEFKETDSEFKETRSEFSSSKPEQKDKILEMRRETMFDKSQHDKQTIVGKKKQIRSEELNQIKKTPSSTLDKDSMPDLDSSTSSHALLVGKSDRLSSKDKMNSSKMEENKVVNVQKTPSGSRISMVAQNKSSVVNKERKVVGPAVHGQGQVQSGQVNIEDNLHERHSSPVRGKTSSKLLRKKMNVADVKRLHGQSLGSFISAKKVSSPADKSHVGDKMSSISDTMPNTTKMSSISDTMPNTTKMSSISDTMPNTTKMSSISDTMPNTTKMSSISDTMPNTTKMSTISDTMPNTTTKDFSHASHTLPKLTSQEPMKGNNQVDANIDDALMTQSKSMQENRPLEPGLDCNTECTITGQTVSDSLLKSASKSGSLLDFSFTRAKKPVPPIKLFQRTSTPKPNILGRRRSSPDNTALQTTSSSILAILTSAPIIAKKNSISTVVKTALTTKLAQKTPALPVAQTTSASTLTKETSSWVLTKTTPSTSKAKMVASSATLATSSPVKTFVGQQSAISDGEEVRKSPRKKTDISYSALANYGVMGGKPASPGKMPSLSASQHAHGPVTMPTEPVPFGIDSTQPQKPSSNFFRDN